MAFLSILPLLRFSFGLHALFSSFTDSSTLTLLIVNTLFVSFNIHAKKLKNTPGVKLIQKDNGVKMMTTYTPKFLELPREVWPTVGGRRHAGEGIVIGFVDTGINPSHPSFAYHPRRGYPKNLTRFSGVCDEGPMFPKSSCNGKIVTARYFSAGVKASGLLNASVDILSPYDAVGHGSHVATTAAGNYGVPVVLNGFYYGRASGMAPRARCQRGWKQCGSIGWVRIGEGDILTNGAFFVASGRA